MDYNKYDTEQRSHHHSHGKSIAFGVLVILAGLLLLAKNSGMLEPQVSHIIFSWEMLLVAIGFLNIFSRHSVWSGFILISIGVFFILVDYFSLPFTLWHVFWPVLIIFIGLSLIFGTSRMRKHHYFQNTSVSDDVFEDIAIFGGGERRVMSQEFKGGNIIAVFGGSKIDFSHANLAPGNNVIEVVAAFGGTSMLVPPDWNVKVEVFNIFGGYADKRMISQVDYNKTLVIKGVAIFGGGEIRSF
jgi:predicted membrane protein